MKVHLDTVVRASVLSLGLIASSLAGGDASAQAPPPARLTVRPSTMATGKQTARAGEQPLDAVPGASAYVPPQCVGAVRCPLVVVVPSTYRKVNSLERSWGRVADKHGMIAVAPAVPATGAEENRWDDPPGLKSIDAAMTQALGKFAIDPNRVAIVGLENDAFVVGGYNTDVFSRIVAVRAGNSPTHGVRAPTDKVEFLFVSGIGSPGHSGFGPAQDLQRQGHRVKHLFSSLWDNWDEANDYVGQWLQQSWATPNPAARPAPKVVADPLPLLTPDVLDTMAAFWASFLKQPDSIRTTARQASVREVVLPIGQEPASILMMNMPALAAKYPSITADLKAAGLTAQEFDAYRVALASAATTGGLGRRAGPLDTASVLGKNTESRYAKFGKFEATLWAMSNLP